VGEERLLSLYVDSIERARFMLQAA